MSGSVCPQSVSIGLEELKTVLERMCIITRVQ